MTTFWRGVGVTVQDGAPGAAQTITGITKASPGVITTSGTLPTNGQYVLLEIQGMSQLNYAVGKVAGASGSTFNVGVDTTLYSDFTSGTFKVLTIDQAMSAMRDISATGGDAVEEDTTTLHDQQDTADVTGASAIGYNFTEDFGTTAAGYVELRAAAEALSPRAVKFVFANAKEQVFYATASVPGHAMQSGQKVVTPITLKCKGRVTVY